MASQFAVIKNDTGGFDVYMRDLVSHGEYTNRFSHLVLECGFSPEDAAAELYMMIGQFIKKTVSPDAPLQMCTQFVWDFIDPGDIVQLGQTFFVVNAPAKE